MLFREVGPFADFDITFAGADEEIRGACELLMFFHHRVRIKRHLKVDPTIGLKFVIFGEREINRTVFGGEMDGALTAGFLLLYVRLVHLDSLARFVIHHSQFAGFFVLIDAVNFCRDGEIAQFDFHERFHIDDLPSHVALFRLDLGRPCKPLAQGFALDSHGERR